MAAREEIRKEESDLEVSQIMINLSMNLLLHVLVSHSTETRKKLFNEIVDKINGTLFEIDNEMENRDENG